MATTQNKKHNKIAAETTVASVCSIACVMVWLCSRDPIACVMVWPCSRDHGIMDAVSVSIAATQACNVANIVIWLCRIDPVARSRVSWKV